jgi:hypothetical protein
MLSIRLALSAVGNSIRKALLPEMLKASFIVRKLAVKILDCVSKVSGNRLSAVHDATNLAKT